MKLNLTPDLLRIEWEWYEQLLAFTFQNPFEIPLAHIQAVSTDEPPSSWREIRAPGTSLPGVIKAGTYYTPGAKEFWYVTQDRDYLVLELQDESYQKVVLTVENSQYWYDQIRQQLVR